MVTIAIAGLAVALGGRPILHDIGATLERGQLVGVIGPNGAGKSTLARAILGLIATDRGDVRLDGADVAAMKRADVARRIAYLPQGQTLHWPLTVERLVALGRLPHLGPFSRMTAADRLAVERAMAMTDVAPLRARVATALSGGERVRVLLARALAVEAPALIADEPLASLDPGHQLEVMAMLKQQAASGALVVAVLHDLTMAARFCDRLLVIDRGRIVADGPPASVLTARLLDDVYGIGAWIGASDGLPMIVPLDRRRSRRSAID